MNTTEQTQTVLGAAPSADSGTSCPRSHETANNDTSTTGPGPAGPNACSIEHEDQRALISHARTEVRNAPRVAA